MDGQITMEDSALPKSDKHLTSKSPSSHVAQHKGPADVEPIVSPRDESARSPSNESTDAAPTRSGVDHAVPLSTQESGGTYQTYHEAAHRSRPEQQMVPAENAPELLQKAISVLLDDQSRRALLDDLKQQVLDETRQVNQAALQSVEQTRRSLEDRLMTYVMPTLVGSEPRRHTTPPQVAGGRRGAMGFQPDSDAVPTSPVAAYAPIRTRSLGIVDEGGIDGNGYRKSGNGNELDWVIPSVSKFGASTVGEKLQLTTQIAEAELLKAKARAKLTGMAVNICIGLQVILGALTTALSVVTEGKQTNIMTSTTGALATVVATMLAKLRGMHEPEHSNERVKELSSFIRDCQIFQNDQGEKSGPEYAKTLDAFRERLEVILGNKSSQRTQHPTLNA